MNYNLLMEEQLKHLQETPTLLLHSCCAPCSSAVIEKLGNYFKITVFFYNPNITDDVEYQKRLTELKNFIKRFKVKNPINIIEGEYEKKAFLAISKGHENDKERGQRCFNCYKLRMQKTAEMASQYSFDYFTTTLSLSPYKNSVWINAIGEDLNKAYSAQYLYADFKKDNGYLRSIELSKEYNLYRQNYCGCIYSQKNV